MGFYDKLSEKLVQKSSNYFFLLDENRPLQQIRFSYCSPKVNDRLLLIRFVYYLKKNYGKSKMHCWLKKYPFLICGRIPLGYYFDFFCTYTHTENSWLTKKIVLKILFAKLVQLIIFQKLKKIHFYFQFLNIIYSTKPQFWTLS